MGTRWVKAGWNQCTHIVVSSTGNIEQKMSEAVYKYLMKMFSAWVWVLMIPRYERLYSSDF